MKKFVSLMLAGVTALSLAACSGGSSSGGNSGGTTPTADAQPEEPAMKVAMITDYGDITDQSFNQTTYEAAKAYCEANGLEFNYFKPAGDSTSERVAMIDKAISDGFNTLVMPGYAFAGAIAETVEMYPDVKYIALDVSEFDLTDAGLATIPENLFSAVYQEEIAGYFAGQAAVKLGYEKLGFLGGMAVPAVIRYGYGFVQGASDAAVDLGKQVDINYAYGNQFYGDSDITAAMDTWYSAGTEVVFACGGGIFTSAADAAKKVNAKVIGVDVDQAANIDAYAEEEGMTVTSAMKGLAATVNTLLAAVKNDEWSKFGGQIQNLGLVSDTDMSLNYVGLPASTQWAEGFTEADYNQLVADIFSGKIAVSANAEDEAYQALSGSDSVVLESEGAAVNYQGNIK